MQTLKKFAPHLLLLSTIYITTIWINFYYIATLNVDFNKYYSFINNLSGIEDKIEYGQNSLYYYLVLIILKLRIEFISADNVNLIISNSVQILNLLFYLIGLIGLFQFLKTYKFLNQNILFSLSILSFFPQSIYLRAVMKPEILSFALFPWILYFIRTYLESKNIKYLYIITIPLSLILNLKASIAGMVVAYLIIFHFNDLKKIKIKNVLTLLFLLICIFSLIQFENLQITENYIFERNYEEEYDNKADPLILFKFDLKNLFLKPFLKYDYENNFYSIHANSVLNITLLDTFGDHFEQLFDSDLNYFFRHRKIFVQPGETNSFNENRVFEYSGPFNSLISYNIDHLRKITSIIYSILFLFLTIYYSIFDKNNRNIYLAPIIGIFVLYLNSLGIPSNNYSPYKGDTFKAFYYSFFLLISFSFIICKLIKLKNSLLIKLLITFIFIPSVFFIGGHPKYNDQNFSMYLVDANDYSYFCGLNNLLFFENTFIKSIHPSGNINNIKSDCVLKSNEEDTNSLKLLYDHCFDESSKEPVLLDKENYTSDKCRSYYFKIIDNDFLETNQKIPFASIIILMSSLLLFFQRFRKIINVY